jgi:oxygen-independent coproporphyrinogen-3 oxidase
MEKTGLYIHFPFCKRACFYCHFVKQEYDGPLVERYIAALTEEIGLHADTGCVIDSIYIGGGSPSLLTPAQLATITGAIARGFTLEKDIEFTVELNPEDVNKNLLQAMKEEGVNRLSIGTQSFDPLDLDYLQRTHSSGQNIEAIETALDCGFTNLNIDFIISLITQSKDTLAANFARLHRYDIPHISAYILEDVENGESKDDRDRDLYFYTCKSLQRLGYNHYEVSNFSKPGCRSRHNLKYWRNDRYIGAGLSASGYLEGRDYKNCIDFDRYFEKIGAGRLPQEDSEQLDPGVRRIVTGLRMMEGVPEEYFSNHPDALDLLLSNDKLTRKGGKIAVDPSQILLLNEILTYFM